MILNVAEINTNKVEQVRQLTCDEEMQDYISIPLEDMTPDEKKEYIKHKRERNKRVFKKFGVDYER